MKSSNNLSFQRRFLVNGLPEGCSPADPHLQMFDNYVASSGLRLRKTRDPLTDSRDWMLEKLEYDRKNPEIFNRSQIKLSKSEYRLFDAFLGRETRKNRYRTKDSVFYDIFLGELRGLNILKIEFATRDECSGLEIPSDAIVEITGDLFFTEKNLVEVKFDDIRNHLSNKNEAST